MIDDILEQIAEDYFRNRGYFTQHNVKYKPDKKGVKYAVHSDVDVVGIHPRKSGKKRVVVVSCKSWQGGLNIEKDLEILEKKPNKRIAGREHWKRFREVADKIWAEALKKKVYKLTGQKEFEFYLVVTKYKGDKQEWENFPQFKQNLSGCKIKLIDMKTMVLDTYRSLNTTPGHSELGRLLQLIKADKGKIHYKNM